jgi:hypothetical protein
LLVGSGLSRAAQIPTGWEITLDLLRRVGLLKGVPDQADWVAWYRNSYKKNPDYSELLSALASTPDERRAILHRYIDASPEDIEQASRVPTTWQWNDAGSEHTFKRAGQGFEGDREEEGFACLTG